MCSSVNLAVTLGSQVTLTSGDPIYSLVVAWALYAIADDLKPNKSYLRQDKVQAYTYLYNTFYGLQLGRRGARMGVDACHGLNGPTHH